MGIETTSSYPTKDHAWNEISGRYTPVTDFYVPDVWRKQSEENKQASSGRLRQDDQTRAERLFDKSMEIIVDTYNRLLALGVAKEQARIILPLNMYTEVYWTASFQAIMNFLELRLDAHAQWEIREYAAVVLGYMKELFPITTQIWLE